MHSSPAAKKSLALLALLSLVTACAPGGIPGGSSGTVLGPGDALPAISAGGWLNSSGFDVSNLAGRVLVIDVFASW